MIKTICFLIIINPLLCMASSSDYKTMIKEGKSCGKRIHETAPKDIINIDVNDFLPPDQKGKEFDINQAKKSIDSHERPKSEVFNLFESKNFKENISANTITGNEDFLKRANEVLQAHDAYLNSIIEERSIEKKTEKCFLSSVPSTLTLYRNLEVNVIHHPKSVESIKVCEGHSKKKKYFWKSDAYKAKEKYEKEFSANPGIKSFKIHIRGGDGFSDYTVEISFLHKNQIASCDNFKQQDKVTKEESWEESGDTWITENPSDFLPAQSPDCTLVEISCLDETPFKVINGKKVSRKCWKQKFSYLCKLSNKDGCAPLKEKNCELISKKCLKEEDFGCALWECFYKCPVKIHKKLTSQEKKGWIGEESDSWDTEYEPNHSFNEVSNKLIVFSEIKKELDASGADNVKNLSVFKGKKMECSKSVAENLLYDCCFSYKGLANKAHLSKCSADELSLGEMREKGLCTYIGRYDVKFLDLLKNKTVHSFCCYSSKMARVFQEEIHKQLGLDWGKPENPNCSGLTLDAISKADFSKLDLSQIFEGANSKLPDSFQEKIESFKGKVKEKLQTQGGT